MTDLEKIRRVHLVAICGTGMAALAGMLHRRGFHVTGSDSGVYPPMSDLLDRLGITYQTRYDASNIDDGIDVAIIGNAVSKDNPEVQEILRRQIRYFSMPQALRTFFLEKRSPIVVAGTHGKTTTAALLAWVLDQAGLDPGFMIGGWSVNLDSNSRVGSGEYFVVEGDEYDTAFFDKGPKFLHYAPQRAILTNIEYDHADIFSSLEEIKDVFSAFVRLVPRKGVLISAKDELVQKVVQASRAWRESYGLHPEADWRADDAQFGARGVSFNVFHRRERFGKFECPLHGRHNLENALAVVALCSWLGLDCETIAKGLSTFRGVKRRQEVVGEIEGVVIMDDFAHHPTAIRETLAALRLGYPDRRIWAVFEPRSATARRRIFQDTLPLALSQADRAVISNPFPDSRLDPKDRLDSEAVVARLRKMDRPADNWADADTIVEKILPELRPGDLICVMSSGGFGGIHKKLLNALKERGPGR